MDSLVFVVRRDRTDLYDGLVALFRRDSDVAVILDRRAHERRRREGPHPEERRCQDRRLRMPVDLDLAARGWTVVRVR